MSRLRACRASDFTPRVQLAILIAWVLFANHWARDSLGALELPLESPSDGYRLSPKEYNGLSTAYFLPNCIVPLIGGVLAQRGNAGGIYVRFLCILLLGCVLVGASALVAHATFGCDGACSKVPYALLLAGRTLMGVSYEATDMIGPITFLQPRFADVWATLVSIINGINRLGSVLNFLIEPLLYDAFGLRGALLVPSALGASTVLAGMAARRIHERYPLDAPGSAETSASTGVELTSSKQMVADGETAESDDVEAAASPAYAVSEGGGVLSQLARLFGVTVQDLRQGLGLRFWLFLGGAACTYGAVVPFWFIGAKHISVAWGYSLTAADVMMLFPEGLIGIIGPVLGCIVDRYQWRLSTRLLVSSVSLGLVACALLLLAWAPRIVPPLPLVLLLGLGYAFAQNLIWMTFPSLAPASMLNLIGGLLGSSLNVAPTVLPVLVLSGVDLSRDMACLGAVGVFGAALYLVAAAQECCSSAVASSSRGMDGGPSDEVSSASTEGRRRGVGGKRRDYSVRRVKTTTDRESVLTLVHNGSDSSAAPV
jgi:MFS family permease